MAHKITTRLLLRELFKCNGGVNIYRVHQQYRLPINEIILIVTDLKEIGLVTLDDLTIKPTETLRAWVFKNRYKIFFSKDETWKDIPQQFLIPRLPVEQLPNTEITKKHKSK